MIVAMVRGWENEPAGRVGEGGGVGMRSVEVTVVQCLMCSDSSGPMVGGGGACLISSL